MFSTGTIQGGVSAASIYALTNVFGLAAPSAAAVTSGIFGLIDAVVKYRSGKIDDDGFIDLVIFNSIDATGAALGAVVGSKIIPVPVLGPVVGSIATTTAIRMGKSILNERELRLLKLHQSKVNRYIKNIDEKYTDFHQELINSYKSLGSLQKFAFDLKLNLQLQLMHSVTLAEETGVSGVEILYDRDAIDKYFLQ